MDKDTRNAIERATQRARKLLEEDFAAQLEGDFDVHKSGAVAAKPGGHLSARQAFQRERIIAAIEHKRAAEMSAAESVVDYLRDAAFTTLNRFVALKMLEARELVQECITKGEQSAGYREYCGMAPGLPLLPDSAGYRLYIESLFDELSTEVKVLFDRRDPSSVLWPKRATFEQLLDILNATELAHVWGEDETIGWVYQFFNGEEDRKAARYDDNGKPKVPQNSRELAVRNQFFTPRYVVQFLTDNTLGRIWYEMRCTKTVLTDKCEYMARKTGEEFAPRAKKDPRDLRVLDPACGSGHFLLYAFDLLLSIYEEAYADPESPRSEVTSKTLAEDYPSLDALRKAVPSLIFAHNLYGVDIDPRCAQIARLALWMRAQKAYRDLDIGRAERAQIRRSNIVVAEPLVADEQIAKEFLAKLSDAELGHVFMTLIESLNLAGDLGLLLRIEKLIGGQTKHGQTGDLFAPTEERIRAALESFVSDSAIRTSTKRRFFAEDAAHGLALLGVAETKFDVVLMNPPFGSPPDGANAHLSKEDCGNLYSAFVRRAVELGADAVGCITDRTFLTQASFKSFRLELLRNDIRLKCLADLGWGVLDANVQTTAYVLFRESNYVHCIDARPHDEKAPLLHGSGGWKVVQHTSLARLPDCVFAFGLPDAVLTRASEWPALSDIATLPRGLGSNKAERTYLAWFEVPITQPNPRRWEPLANGGDFSPWWREDLGVADWRMPAGRPWVSMGSSDPSRPYDQGMSNEYFRAGLSFPKQSASFNVAALAEGFLPTREGKAVIPEKSGDRWWLLAYLNSGPVRAFVRDTCGLHKQSGAIGRIPVAPFDDAEKEELATIAKQIVQQVIRSQRENETSHHFVGPRLGAQTVDPASYLSALDALVLEKFGLQSGDVWTESACAPSSYEPSESDLTSWLVGLVFGRFRESIGENTSELDPFAPVNLTRSPGMYPEGEDPSSRPDILVDDKGHPDDFAARTRAIAERVQVDVPENLRDWLAKEFFPLHIKMYSKSRRKAPIYWQLATPSASYSVWLYIHEFSKDTLFRVQKDYAAPKLAHEERRLESLTNELRDGATADQRKTLAAQEGLVDELRTFLDEVKRVAPLWSPNLDDGVMINFSLLWRLVPQNKSWQKELKSTWDALCDGKYDWTHLAMHLWPERVVPRCLKDRSLAIAHGFEDLFWIESPGGKWTTRKAPARNVDELVLERTSPAVKSALKSLLEAPVATGKNAGRTYRHKAASIAEGGNA
ncbi:Eco57I restriction-modification methylase domain-containing protein [Burkholderia ambifaria]|uniref:Eco57I restriction-modification methylase domain-containing protein n=1 Tax=Burkholderia ambifaria TaxID=152480 RepID=UPI00158B95E2|nr:DNA methyltransferase [Burkholderia ambifaria]